MTMVVNQTGKANLSDDITNSLQFVAREVGSQLLTLNLPNNMIRDSAMEQIVEECLSLCPVLEYLDLSGNLLADFSLKPLFGKFVSGHKRLKSLKLNFNKIRKAETAEELQVALSLCPNLEELFLKRCNLTDDSFKAICEGV
jgi:Leucine-rich repeat (LRR) protein